MSFYENTIFLASSITSLTGIAETEENEGGKNMNGATGNENFLGNCRTKSEKIFDSDKIIIKSETIADMTNVDGNVKANLSGNVQLCQLCGKNVNK